MPSTVEVFVTLDDLDNRDWAKLKVLANDENVSVLRLNLSRMPMITTHGIGVLLAVKRRQEIAGGTMRLVSVPPVVMDTLRASGMLDLFNVEGW